jgi:Type I restriction enzyme R protein N terminus (HSDR_N)
MTEGEMIMAKRKEPVEVVATIRRSIEVSTRGTRRVRFERLRDLFGFQAWSQSRKELVARLFEDQGVALQPPLNEAGLNDWVVLSLPIVPPPGHDRPDPRPKPEFFDHLESVHLDSEREVEMHFVSPLFHELGYGEEQEAAGFPFDTWEGVQHRVAEADLLYFAGDRRRLTDGEPLVLVECKNTDKTRPDAGLGQVRSYAFWIKPAYYVTTNGNMLTVYNYQGGAVPDVKVLELKRADLRERFDDLYRVLNPRAAAEARREKIARLTPLARQQT